MNYEVGKQYEMKVVDIRKDSAGHNYIALHDDDPNKEYRVYNILKCQLDSLPDTMYVIVKSIDVFGKIKFAQDIARLNKEHYHEGKLYAFDVIDVKEDHNTNVTYYELEDDFTTHRLYFSGRSCNKSRCDIYPGLRPAGPHRGGCPALPGGSRSPAASFRRLYKAGGGLPWCEIRWRPLWQ